MNAVDMSAFIAPKSDQLNADDLIGGPRIITITRVTGNEGNVEQPVNVFFEGDGGKPFRPCKSMRRVMVAVWGADAAQYVGRSMTIWRDPEVTWGGMKVGGIRISHMSHIDEAKTMALTATQKARKPYTVRPLEIEQGPDKAKEAADKIIANIGRAPDLEKLEAYIAGNKTLASLESDRPELAQSVRDAVDARRSELAPADDDDPFGDQTPAWQSTADDLRDQIEAAKTKPALAAADKKFQQHAAALPDEIAAELDAALAEKRAEVAE